MAPSTAEPARSTRTKSATPAPVVPRIVPAIPLPFTRSQRPKKPPPEDYATAKVSEPSNENAPRTTTQPDAPVAEHLPEPAVTAPELPPATNGHGAHEKTPDNENAGAAVEAPADASRATADAVTPDASSTAEIDNSTAAPEQEPRQEQPQEAGQAVSREPQAPPHTTRPQRPPFELPPPFYPSTDRSTPTSTTSSTFTRPQPPPNPATVHNPRPSANSIVFGGYPDSSSVSPAPPVTNGNLPYPPPGAHLASGMMAPPYPFPGHSHHFSEPHAGMMLPAMGVAPQGNFGIRRDQPLPPHMRPAHSTPSPSATTAGFSPVYPGAAYVQSFSPVHTNGVHSLSRSGSQASSPKIRPPVSDALPIAVHPHPMQNGVVPRDVAVPRFQNAHPQPSAEFGLREYMRAQFANRDYADHVLKLYAHGGRGLILCLPVHGIILGRSRKFADAMAKAHPSHYENGLRVLNVLVDDRFLDGPIFAEALKFLYGEDLLTPRNFLQGLAPFTGSLANADGYGSPSRRMSDALAYAAAGYWLEIRSIVSRGLEIATELLRWDTVETALVFALDGGLDSSWRVDDTPEDSSSDDASSKFDTDFAPTYGPYSTHFLQTINGFLVHNFPNEFELDTSASQLYEIPRLPSVDEPRPTSRNPRLSQIRFGEVPVDPAGPSQFIIGLLSSIILSLPFPVLKALLEDFVLCSRLGKGKVAQMMHNAVEERESRRRKVVKHASAQLEKDEGLQQNLVWCERVEPWPQHASGFRLVRSRQDIDTPASSDKSPEQMH
ncbi:hypothetical protein GTA08_BOTSDO05627 [Neofusicoccum parvum]|nr:hypothetical protein GTA08_BOTSDO05627 [Neofusicoccum parvum]